MKAETPPEGGFPRQTGQSVGSEYRPSQCTCDKEAAADLLNDFTDLAIEGDPDGGRLLLAGIAHYLDTARREASRR